MQDQRIRRIPVGAIAAATVAAIAGGSGLAWWQLSSAPPTPQPPVPTTVQTQPASPQPNQPAQTKPVQVYWLNDVNQRLVLAPEAAKLELTGKPDQDLKLVFNHLLTGPANSADVTTIPAGTQLRSVRVEGNTVRVDLSREFTSGGGSSSMVGRVAQVLYTATTLQPTAKVVISVEGKQLEVLGGEGVMLDQPLTRQQFQTDFNL